MVGEIAREDQSGLLDRSDSIEGTANSAPATVQNVSVDHRRTEGTIGGRPFTNYPANANFTAPTGSFTESLVTFAPGAIKIEAEVTVSFQLD